MDKGTFFLAVIIVIAAAGIGWGVWWYYTDVVPERVLSEQALETDSEEWGGDEETQTANSAGSDLMTVKAFFGNTKLVAPGEECETVFALERRVPKVASVARSALTELLNGVTFEEEAEGYTSSINSGVVIQSLKLENGVLRADFSLALEENVGGSCRVAAIRKQITETAKQFPTVKDVVISVNGRVDDILQP